MMNFRVRSRETNDNPVKLRMFLSKQKQRAMVQDIGRFTGSSNVGNCLSVIQCFTTRLACCSDIRRRVLPFLVMHDAQQRRSLPSGELYKFLPENGWPCLQ